MENIATGEIFADNLKVATPDAGLGATALAVYESWATELGVSLTETLGTEFVTTNSSSYQFTFDLGFNPFINIHSRIYISNTGNISFFSSTNSVDDVKSGLYLYHNMTINGDLWNNMRTTNGPNAHPLLHLTMRDGKIGGDVMVTGGRFQSNGLESIIFMTWGDTNAALRFSSLDQSLDIYVEPLNAIAIIGSVVLDYTVKMLNNAVITTTLAQGTTDFPVLQAFGSVNRFTMGTRPLAIISGNIVNSAGDPIIRRVAAINQDTLAVKDVTTSDALGDYTLRVDPLVDYLVVCIDDEPDAKNALIFDRINVAL